MSTYSVHSISQILSNLKREKVENAIQPDFAVISEDSSKWNETGHLILQFADFFYSSELSEQIGFEVRSQAIPLSPIYGATSEMQGKIKRRARSRFRLLSPITHFLETYATEIRSKKTKITQRPR